MFCSNVGRASKSRRSELARYKGIFISSRIPPLERLVNKHKVTGPFILHFYDHLLKQIGPGETTNLHRPYWKTTSRRSVGCDHKWVVRLFSGLVNILRALGLERIPQKTRLSHYRRRYRLSVETAFRAHAASMAMGPNELGILAITSPSTRPKCNWLSRWRASSIEVAGSSMFHSPPS